MTAAEPSAASEGVVIVGGGISGIACARLLHDAGVPTIVRDRGLRLGGRIAVETIEGRPIDVGAAYFTARHPNFLTTVNAWEQAGLARAWTDTFHLATPEGISGTTTGPMRYAAPLGLRSLVEELAVGLAVSSHDDVSLVGPGPTVDGRLHAAAVVAMPGPQALNILADELVEERDASQRRWEPSLTLVTRFAEREWPAFDGVFVNESAILTFVADDGRRRGDNEAVLVAHSTPVLAAVHLDDPDRALSAMLAELMAVLGITKAPIEALVKRWSLAKPLESVATPFHLGRARVGLCGDGWHGPSRIESAFLSGRSVGRAIARTLGAVL